ncbi:PDZ domain-containing protein [Thalassobacillus hwangdonensis]|uniref:PDZ domain-containing protein n=1 Tax=Thalassobacillus hwangdonensis TaxID=546108 RepID=A0ABW3L5C5_9BACI
MGDWLIELLKGTGRLFLQPLFYWAIMLALVLSYKRIKKERRLFGTRIFDVFAESKRTIGVSLITGLILSALFLVGGFVVSFPVILLISLAIILFTLPLKLKWASAAYTFPIALIALIIINERDLLPEYWNDALSDVSLTGVALMMGALLLVESLIMLRTGYRETFPELVPGTRGKWVGQHRLKKLMVIPFFLFIPGGAILSFAPWWPLLDIGGESYGLMLVPLISGYEFIARGQNPVSAAKHIGRGQFFLSFIVIGMAVGSYWLEALVIVGLVTALIGREFIHLFHRIRDKKQQYFSATGHSLKILGIIQGSPADKMGLLEGEQIERINQRRVTNEREFYEAIQINRAFCKVEVRNHKGQVRFAQRAIYEGEHHGLGIILVKEDGARKQQKSYG